MGTNAIPVPDQGLTSDFDSEKSTFEEFKEMAKLKNGAQELRSPIKDQFLYDFVPKADGGYKFAWDPEDVAEARVEELEFGEQGLTEEPVDPRRKVKPSFIKGNVRDFAFQAYFPEIV